MNVKQGRKKGGSNSTPVGQIWKNAQLDKSPFRPPRRSSFTLFVSLDIFLGLVLPSQ